jgi:antagonist of KipI
MADCQTTGGYPNLASVISADRSFAGQLAPGDSIGFASVSREEALRLCRMQRVELDRWLPAVA